MSTSLILATRAAVFALANLILVQIADGELLDARQRGWLVVGLLDAGFAVTTSARDAPSATLAASRADTKELRLSVTNAEQSSFATLDPTDGAVMLLEIGHRAVSLVEQVKPQSVDVTGPKIALVLERRNASDRATRAYYALASELVTRGAVLAPSDVATHHVCIYAHGFAVSLHTSAPATDCSGDAGEALATSEGTELGAWISELGAAILDKTAPRDDQIHEDTELPSVAPPMSPTSRRIASASIGGLIGWRGALDRAVRVDGVWWLSDTWGAKLDARWTGTSAAEDVSIQEIAAMLSATHTLALVDDIELRSSLGAGGWMHRYHILGARGARLDPSAALELALLFTPTDTLTIGAHLRPTWIRRAITHELDGQEVWRRSSWQLNAGVSVGVDFWRSTGAKK